MVHGLGKVGAQRGDVGVVILVLPILAPNVTLVTNKSCFMKRALMWCSGDLKGRTTIRAIYNQELIGDEVRVERKF